MQDSITGIWFVVRNELMEELCQKVQFYFSRPVAYV